MTFYNLQNPDDRARLRQDRQAELAAVKTQKWPRDINDQMRWIRDSSPEYAAQMCQAEIVYLDDLEVRIKAGDPNLKSYRS